MSSPTIISDTPSSVKADAVREDAPELRSIPVSSPAPPASWGVRPATLEALADWALTRVVVRTDVYGAYTPEGGQYTARGPLDRSLLVRHFRGEVTIGCHSCSTEGQCLVVIADIDAHDEKADPDLNWRTSLRLVAILRTFGLAALVCDSNGKGGYHVRAFFKKPVKAEVAYWLGQRAQAILEAEGLAKLEWFPKQPRLTLDCPYGNWVRLPGKHHKRDHWTRIYDPQTGRWLEGEAAAVRLVKIAGDDTKPLLDAYAAVAPAPAKGKGKSKGKHGALLAKLTKEVAKAPTGERHATLNRAAYHAGGLVSDGLSESEIVAALSAAAREAGLTDERIEKELGDALRDGMANPLGRSIEVNTEEYRVLAETLALLPTDRGLYSKGDFLVTISRHEDEVAKLHGGVELREAKGSAGTVRVGGATLSCRLTELAHFYAKRKNRDGKTSHAPVHPPEWLTKAILERRTFPGVRPLLGIVETPFPREDGSFVTESGYDPKTGYYLATNLKIALPDRPTQRDAAKGADDLYQVVSQFPFADIKGDYAVWLAGLLSVLARPAIAGPVPGFAFIGNRAGVGKGRLIDVIGTLATGRRVPTSSYPESKEEATKCRVALALESTSIIHLDNLEEGSLYGSGPLDSGLTSTVFRDRVLGLNESPLLTLLATWFLSGNKIAPGKDAYRRWLVCNLISSLETPEERTDLEHPDLLRHVLDRRDELVRAALTILKAHALAGRPTGTWGPLGSFEAWDPIVRGAVWYATGVDCNATRKVAAKISPDRVNKIALLEAWADLPGGRTSGVTVARALELSLEVKGDDLKDVRPDFKEVLMRFGKDGKMPTPHALGNVIRRMANTQFEGKMFEVNSTGKYGIAAWCQRALKTSQRGALENQPF